MKYPCIVLICIFFFSCARDPVMLEMDNASDRDIVVELEDMAPFTLGSYKSYSLKMSPGRKTVKFDYGEEINFYLDYRSRTLLNPGQGDYYVKYTNYRSEKAKNMKMSSHQDTMIIGGYKVTGPYKKLKNDIVIRGNWTYGLRGFAPQSIKVTTDQHSLGYIQARKSKLMSERRMINDVEFDLRQRIKKYKASGIDAKLIPTMLGLTDAQFIKLSSPRAGHSN